MGERKTHNISILPMQKVHTQRHTHTHTRPYFTSYTFIRPVFSIQEKKQIFCNRLQYQLMSVPLVNEVNKIFTDREMKKEKNPQFACLYYCTMVSSICMSCSTRKYVKYNEFISLSKGFYEMTAIFLVWHSIFLLLFFFILLSGSIIRELSTHSGGSGGSSNCDTMCIICCHFSRVCINENKSVTIDVDLCTFSSSIFAQNFFFCFFCVCVCALSYACACVVVFVSIDSLHHSKRKRELGHLIRLFVI